MKKIIFLTVCCCLLAVCANAQNQQYDFLKYDSVTVVAQTAGIGMAFGLYKNGAEILPVEYELEVCQGVDLLAFYKDEDLYLYSCSGNFILHQQLDFVVDKDATVCFEQIRGRNNEIYYDLVVYYFNNDWGSQLVGSFARRGNQLYKVKVEKKYTLIK